MIDSQRFFYDRTCAFAGCQRPFTTRNRLQRYCSSPCWFRVKQKQPRHPRWTHADIRLLRELAGKVPARVIAERLGRPSKDTVIAKARQLGLSLRLYGERNPAAKYPDRLVEEARVLHDEGLTPTVIAERLGVPRTAVCSFVYYRSRLGPVVERYI